MLPLFRSSGGQGGDGGRKVKDDEDASVSSPLRRSAASSTANGGASPSPSRSRSSLLSSPLGLFSRGSKNKRRTSPESNLRRNGGDNNNNNNNGTSPLLQTSSSSTSRDIAFGASMHDGGGGVDKLHHPNGDGGSSSSSRTEQRARAQHMPSSQRITGGKSKRHQKFHPTTGEPINAMCSSFLFGGMHPGVVGSSSRRGGRHHQPRGHHLRNNNRSLMYRICLSSPIRICLTFVMFGYVLVTYIVFPLGGVVVRRSWGSSSSSSAAPGDSELGDDAIVVGGGRGGASQEQQQQEQMILIAKRKNEEEELRKILIPVEQSKEYWKSVEEKVRIKQREENEGGDAGGGGRGRRRRKDAYLTEGQLNVLREIAPNWSTTTDHHALDGTDAGDTTAGGGSGDDDGGDELPATGGNDADGAVVRPPDSSSQQQRGRTLQTMDTSQSCPSLSSSAANGSPPPPPDVTLVMQSTPDRLWILEHTCERWSGQLIVVVYHDANAPSSSSWEDIVSEWKESCPQLTLIRYDKPQHEEEWQYPINKLRNIGLDSIRTTHFMVVDIDFVPSKELYRSINNHFRFVGETREALIVPAFERRTTSGSGVCDTVEECRAFLKKDPSFLPRNFEELRRCMNDVDEDEDVSVGVVGGGDKKKKARRRNQTPPKKNKKKKCIVFQSDNNWEGHFTTQSEIWLKRQWYVDAKGDVTDVVEKKGGSIITKDGDRPRPIDCFHSFRYEPYVVLRWCGEHVTPYYDERFYGYGKNKIEYVSHLRFLGYTFAVLPRGFIVHHPHPESRAKMSWNDRDGFDLHMEMDELYPKFLKELLVAYGRPKIDQCQRKKGQY